MITECPVGLWKDGSGRTWASRFIISEIGWVPKRGFKCCNLCHIPEGKTGIDMITQTRKTSEILTRVRRL